MICHKCGMPFNGGSCPNGCNLSNKKPRKPLYKKWWFWVLMGLATLLTTIIMFSDEDTIDESDSVSLYTDSVTSNTTVDEILLYSENDVKIYVKRLEDNALKFLIENNSDLNLGFNAHSYAINGIMTQESIYTMDYDVSAHSKANTKLEIPNSFLQEHKIESIEQIDILFWAYDNDKNFKEFETDVITIKTNAFKNNIACISGSEIYNKKGIIVEFLEQENNEFTFCLTNKTGHYFDFTVSNINVNGFTYDDLDFDLYDEQILNNCQFVYTIKIDKKFLNNNDIEKISTVSFNFEIEPEGDVFNDWSTDIITYTKK